MLRLLTPILLSSCLLEDPYIEYLEGLPRRDPDGGELAIREVTLVYGLDRETFDVHWVETEDGQPIRSYDPDRYSLGLFGVTFDCHSYVWLPDHSKVITKISESSLAHEMGHCAMSALGLRDIDHSDPTWWDPDTGLVHEAEQAVVAIGL